jgi:hypothetical protein
MSRSTASKARTAKDAPQRNPGVVDQAEPEMTARGRCAARGPAETPDATLLPIRVGAHAGLHPDC